jgi:hypothetical protein
VCAQGWRFGLAAGVGERALVLLSACLRHQTSCRRRSSLRTKSRRLLHGTRQTKQDRGVDMLRPVCLHVCRPEATRAWACFVAESLLAHNVLLASPQQHHIKEIVCHQQMLIERASKENSRCLVSPGSVPSPKCLYYKLVLIMPGLMDALCYGLQTCSKDYLTYQSRATPNLTHGSPLSGLPVAWSPSFIPSLQGG